MGSLSWKQAAGWSGVAFVVLFIGSSAFVADIPPPGDPAVRGWLDDREAAIAWTTWGGGLALGVLFLLFASGLRSQLSARGGESTAEWSGLAFGGAITMAVLGLTKAVFLAVLRLDGVRSSITDQTAVALAAFDSVAVASLVPWGATAFLVGASVSILRSGAMSRSLAWVGLVGATAFAVGTLWLFTGDIEGPLALLTLGGYATFLVFAAGASLTLIRGSRARA